MHHKNVWRSDGIVPHTFLTLESDGSKLSASCPSFFNVRGEKKTVYPADRRLGWRRTSLDTAEKRKITVSAGNLTPVLQLSSP
jgi:ribosomal protein L39E